MYLKRSFGIITFVVLPLLLAVGFASSVGISKTAHAAEGCSIDQGVWIGTFEFGLNCLDTTGWHVLIQRKGDNKIADVVVCPDKRVWVAHLRGLSIFDGKAWAEVETEDAATAKLACDQNGAILDGALQRSKSL